MQPHLHIPSVGAARWGFSLLEATIAITVLLSALLLTVGQFQNVRTVQRGAQERLQVDRVLMALVERFNGAQWNDLGTTNAKWSAPRYEAATGVISCPPMSERNTDPLGADANYDANNNIQTLGLTATTIGVFNLEIYVEYYRAVNFRDGSGAIDASQAGALENVFNTPGTFKSACYVDPATPEQGLKPAFRVASTWQTTANAAGTSPASLVGPDDPLLIRIVATWGPPDASGKPSFRREIFTARSP